MIGELDYERIATTSFRVSTFTEEALRRVSQAIVEAFYQRNDRVIEPPTHTDQWVSSPTSELLDLEGDIDEENFTPDPLNPPNKAIENIFCSGGEVELTSSKMIMVRHKTGPSDKAYRLT